jgi:hypothetical protein
MKEQEQELSTFREEKKNQEKLIDEANKTIL